MPAVPVLESRRPRDAVGRRRPARADRVRLDRARARRWTPTEIERELRRSIRARRAARRPAAHDRDERQVAGRARQRLRRVRRADPAHLRLRGDARLGCRARRHRRAARGAPAGAAADARARRRDQAHRPGAARVRPRRAGGGDRPDRRPRLRRARDPDAVRPLPDRRQDRQPAAADRGAAAVLDARGDGRLPGRGARCRDARVARARSVRGLQGAALLLLDADAVQLGHQPRAAVLVLPLLHRGHADLDRRARHRRERDVLEVGRRPRRLVDGGARHRRPHRSRPTARARASCRS